MSVTRHVAQLVNDLEEERGLLFEALLYVSEYPNRVTHPEDDAISLAEYARDVLNDGVA